MANRKVRKAAPGSPRKRREPPRPAGSERGVREGEAFVEATHQVIEDEIRRGDIPAAPDRWRG